MDLRYAGVHGCIPIGMCTCNRLVGCIGMYICALTQSPSVARSLPNQSDWEAILGSGQSTKFECEAVKVGLGRDHERLECSGWGFGDPGL